MKPLKSYSVRYNYYVVKNGQYTSEDFIHTVQAHTKKEAREVFNEWHDKHGDIRNYSHGQPVRRHPYNVTIILKPEPEPGIRHWRVEYSHDDGRQGTVEVTTEIAKSEGFDYGNRMVGALKINGDVFGYDLRYCVSEDLHRVMLDWYFGDGLVKADRI